MECHLPRRSINNAIILIFRQDLPSQSCINEPSFNGRKAATRELGHQKIMKKYKQPILFGCAICKRSCSKYIGSSAVESLRYGSSKCIGERLCAVLGNPRSVSMMEKRLRSVLLAHFWAAVNSRRVSISAVVNGAT